MTDGEMKKGKETAKPKGLVSSLHERRLMAGATDSFDDDALDAFLEKTVGGVDEPRLVLRERLLTGPCLIREV